MQWVWWQKKGQYASYLNPQNSTRILRISYLMISAYFSSIKKLKFDFFFFAAAGDKAMEKQKIISIETQI